MSDTKHTSGPWTLRIEEGHAESGYREIYVEGSGHDLAIIYCDESVMSWAKDRANARLIAAAPDLYAALAGLLAMIDSVTLRQERELREEFVPKAVAALAKARGES